MNRRTFLKQASGYALAVAGTMTGVEKVFAELITAKKVVHIIFITTQSRGRILSIVI